MTRGIAIGIISAVTMGLPGSAQQAPAKAQGGRSAAETAAAKALKNPVVSGAASLDAGRLVYAKFCRSCHGAEGKGDGPGGAAVKDPKPANLADEQWDHGSTDGEIFTTIKNGVGPKFDMDAWDGRIPDQEIWNVVNYIKTLSKGGSPSAK